MLVYWCLTPQQQPGSYQGGEMMMKSVFWWRKPEYPEETTDLRQVTDETFHTYGLCPVRGLNLGRSGVKQSELRRDESGALAHRSTAVPKKDKFSTPQKNVFHCQKTLTRNIIFRWQFPLICGPVSTLNVILNDMISALLKVDMFQSICRCSTRLTRVCC